MSKLLELVNDRDPLYNQQLVLSPNEKPLYANSQRIQANQHIPSALQETESNKKITASAPLPTWETTLEKCIKSIVSIKATRVRCLDTEIPCVFSATGFVVDAERGIILSNRHVVSVSPLVAQAVLCNYEEIDLKPIYRDPIHDFGFFQYDPTKVRFLNMSAIELFPEGARVGQEIKVVGNDAGEKLSILSGTLARLDRDAPEYGIGEYNDFNTFYYQAASSTSAGSSGSPVLDLNGRAIALNAGGASRSSSSYYLPLYRIKRALHCIQNQREIPRGTLQTEFIYKSYDELLQLGLGQHIEHKLRSLNRFQLNHEQDHQGLLVVKSLLPGGPADSYLEPGDILLTGNGVVIATFIELEDLLDNNVGQSICLVISRAGELKELSMTVQDLHTITPHEYVEFGGGIMHDLSYQMAHSYGISLNNPGVYIAASGYIMGSAYALRKSIIKSIDNKPIRHLNDFIDIMKEIPHGSHVPIRFYSLHRPLKDKMMLLHVDRRWHQFSKATRNDQTGHWDYEPLSDTKFILPTLSPSKPTLTVNNKSSKISEQALSDPLIKLSKSLVSIDCYAPFVIDGLQSSHTFGAGVIVSLNPPLVICDRDTVSSAVGNIFLTFNNSISINAQLEFLHPFYNFALLSFDPKKVSSSETEYYAAEISDIELRRGDRTNYVGLGGDSLPVIKKTSIAAIRIMQTKECTPPRWRAVNSEVLKTGESLSGQGGILADNEGRIQALWMNFSTENEEKEAINIMGGIATKLWKPTLTKMIQYNRCSNENSAFIEHKRLRCPSIYGLDIEFWTMQLAHARLLNLSEKWLTIFNESEYPHVLYILGFTNPSSPCAKVLKVGDLVLSINGDTMFNVSDLNKYDQEESLTMVIFRDGQEMNLKVLTTEYDGQETTRVIGWQGMYIQEAYQAAKEQMREKVPEGVYVSCCLFGSPAHVSIEVGVWITEINQIPVPTLDAFLDVITKKINSNNNNKSKNDLKNSIEQQNEFERRQRPQDTSINQHHFDLLHNKNNDKNITEWLLSKSDGEKLKNTDSSTHVRVKYVSKNNVTKISMLRLDLRYWPSWEVKKDDTNFLGWKYQSFT
ncbi:hypothetical protein BJ944DRAFT_242360 [Cunninghamella echinulata]|nr:hypothetical protein BJ944DRAFT_242360 [Cunninghamella echinulata]